MEKTQLITVSQIEKMKVTPDWNSQKSYVYLNPRFDEPLKGKILEALSHVEIGPRSLVLTSSGSQGIPKVYLFSFEAFLNAAKRVAKTFLLSESDKWLCPLPMFHVGALSISARAFVCDSSFHVFGFDKWATKPFVEALKSQHSTHTSLVPTQLFDLVREKFKAPSYLKLLFIGGDRLDQKLYQDALTLGWPVVPTYGMTEACGMIARARGQVTFDSNGLVEFETMTGITLKIAGGNFVGPLELKCASLFAAQLKFGDGEIPVWDYRDVDSFWPSQDMVEMFNSQGSNPFFVFKGRADRLTKVRGELVDLSYYQKKVARLLGLDSNNLEFQIAPDGRPFIVTVERKFAAESFIETVNQVVPPFLKISRIEVGILNSQNSSAARTWKD